jgi:hypothetical protein
MEANHCSTRGAAMKSEVKSRLFCMASSELTSGISQICSRTAGLDAGEIHAIDPGTLRLLNPELDENADASAAFGKLLKTSHASDIASVIGVIIDVTVESAAILEWLRDSPETVCYAGLRAFEQFQATHTIPDCVVDVQPFSKALRLLTLAILLSKSGMLCLLCIGRDARDDYMEGLAGVLNRAANTRPLGFRFVLGDTPELALETAIRAVNALQCVGGRAFSTPSTSRGGLLVLEPIEHYSEQWEAEEFEEDEVIEAIRAKVANVRKGAGVDREAREVLLRSATLARLLATRSFEHHGCNATIVLADRERISELSVNSRLLGRQVFSFETGSRPTWFHLADPFLRDEGIETALSSRSVLLVDLHTGQVLGVWELNCQSETRFQILNQLTAFGEHSGVFVLAALESGYVEIHHQQSLTFWYDRYRWRHDPFGQMQRRIKEAGVLPDGSSKQDLEKLCAAISILMDAQESSILVFARAEHLQQIEEVLKPMRPNLGLRGAAAWQLVSGNETESGKALVGKAEIPRVTFTSSPLQDLSASMLASVFRLDGAHVICDGRIIRLAERIVLSQEQPKPLSDSNNHGTGRTAAQSLAERVRGSVVVKVSSSGELRVYSWPAAR